MVSLNTDLHIPVLHWCMWYDFVHSEGTELPRAYIVPTKPLSSLTPSMQQAIAQSITQFITSNLAYYKQLKGGVVFVESIPKSSSGKIMRRVVREWAKTEMARPTGFGMASITGTQSLSAAAPADNLDRGQGTARTPYVEPRGDTGIVKANL